MKLLNKDLMNKWLSEAVHRLPYSADLVAACRAYSDRFDGAPPPSVETAPIVEPPSAPPPPAPPSYENNGDMNTNGELRLFESLAPRLKVVFDVGANIGEWTALLLSRAPNLENVYAFEPSHAAYAKLVERNFPPLVKLQHVGLSSKSAKAQLYIYGEAAGVNSLYNREGLEDGWGIKPAEETEEIKLVSLDKFCRDQGIGAVDFVKIDTEGHELEVLEGAKQSLKKGILKIIQFEYGGTYIDSRRLLKDVFQLIAPLNYTIFLIAPDRLIPYPRYDQRLENFQYKNFAIVHKDAVDWLGETAA